MYVDMIIIMHRIASHARYKIHARVKEPLNLELPRNDRVKTPKHLGLLEHLGD
jgi:hypothetical protein